MTIRRPESTRCCFAMPENLLQSCAAMSLIGLQAGSAASKILTRREKPMELHISYCGLICRTCPIHLATREIDQAKRKKMRANIAEQCNKLYGTKYGQEDINDCDGCRAETGRLFSGCKTCSIRSCAKNKGLDNCACCSEYACEQLLKLFATEPEAKKRLDRIRSRRQSCSD